MAAPAPAHGRTCTCKWPQLHLQHPAHRSCVQPIHPKKHSYCCNNYSSFTAVSFCTSGPTSYFGHNAQRPACSIRSAIAAAAGLAVLTHVDIANGRATLVSLLPAIAHTKRHVAPLLKRQSSIYDLRQFPGTPIYLAAAEQALRGCIVIDTAVCVGLIVCYSVDIVLQKDTSRYCKLLTLRALSSLTIRTLCVYVTSSSLEGSPAGCDWHDQFECAHDLHA